MKYIQKYVLFLVVMTGLSACGGTKMLKEQEPLVATRAPLAVTSDQNLLATLDWVIFRDGPGTWAKNVDWDEYLIRIKNLGDEPLEITTVSIVGSLGTTVEPGLNRSQLVKGTKKTKRRYKGEGVKVKAGMSGKVLVGTGVFMAAGTSGLGAAAMAGGGVAAGAAGVVLLVPALAVGGVVRGINNSKVNTHIENRQTPLPIVLAGNTEISLDIFFPLSPSPGRVEVSYSGAQGEGTLIVDTHSALEGLHLTQTDE